MLHIHDRFYRFLRFEPNRAGFIKSPFKSEKTASCKLYDGLGKGFCDFSTGTSGDCIKFVSMTQGVDNWTAAKMMVEAFQLSFVFIVTAS